MSALLGDLGVADPDDLQAVDATYRELGFVVLRGLLSEDEVAEVEAQCVAAQEAVAAGTVPERYGSTAFLNAVGLDEASKAESFVNYVEHVTELAPAADGVARHPVVEAFARRHLGPDAWLLHDHRFGVVYQDARPGRESGYTRIGWHSDWQSAPSRDVWPGTAFTLHIDGTSPANGFLRVVAGSHRWATPAPFRNVNDVPLPEGSRPWGGHTVEPPPYDMPLGFDKVPGEVALYLERGDLLLHDAYVWHSAARATDDASRRRHLRGSWFAHPEPDGGQFQEFVKNAAR